MLKILAIWVTIDKASTENEKKALVYSRCAVSTSVHVFIQSLQDIVTFFCFTKHALLHALHATFYQIVFWGLFFPPPYLLCCAHLSADFVKAFALPVNRPGGSVPAYVDWPVKKKEKKFQREQYSPKNRSMLADRNVVLRSFPLHFSFLSLWEEQQNSHICSVRKIMTSQSHNNLFYETH